MFTLQEIIDSMLLPVLPVRLEALDKSLIFLDLCWNNREG